MRNNLTTTSTVTTKYQTVIPAKVRDALGIEEAAGELIWQIISAAGKPAVLVIPKTKNWASYLSGLGKRVWKGVDTAAYLKALRAEWRT